jgi:LCP family protein required for cell wall assembly
VNRHVHLNDQQLLSHLTHELPSGQRERAAAHLRDCPACRARLEHLAQATADLTTTLHAVGEQVPTATARSWENVSQHWKPQRTRRGTFLFRLPLRHIATLAVLVLIVAGLAGLIHTLAVTGPALTKATPTPSPTSPASPSPPPGPLPRMSPASQAAPVSVLILGIDGERATSDEVDALMLLHLDAESKRAFLLSIPRNLYVEVPGYGQARAGSVYGLGERDAVSSGLTLARETISMTLGLPTQRTVLVRFDSFVGLIDTIGGVDVEVPHPINDPRFPDNQGGFDPLVIPDGRQHFDGASALRYARTRVVPAPGFDRASRQRQLALAVHDRVTRLDLLPDLISQAPTLWSEIAGGLETDLSLSAVIDLALLATNLTTDDITTAALDECCTVEYTTSAGARVLLPQPDEIETLITSLLEEE